MLDVALASAQTAERLLGQEGLADQLPEQFALARLRILTKQKRLAPLVYNVVQRDLMSNLTGRDLVLKARQHGVSTAIQGYLYQLSVTGTATTMTLAHDDDSTQKLRRITERFYRHDPQAPQRGAANARLTTYPANDSEVMIATAGNRTSGRSATLSHLHGSEVAFWPDAESLIGAAVQAGDPSVILESTPNGAQGYFYNLCMEALDGSGVWKLHFYPWWSDREYRLTLSEMLIYTDEEAALADKHGLSAEQINWRREKQKELKHLFYQEYPEDIVACFLQSGNGYFGDISGCFKAPDNPVPDKGHRYVAGLDFGQTNDYTSLKIVDATAGHLVETLHINRLPWQEMRRQIIVKLMAWNVEVVVPERNSMGQTNIEALESEMRTANCRTRIQPFDTTNASKYLVMGNLHTALHDGVLKLQNIPTLRHELNAFAAVQLPSGAWKLSAPDGEHDDEVIALALAWFGITNYRPHGGIFV